jgi:hypothetical protein
MPNHPAPQIQVPDWFFETIKVVQHSASALRDMEFELRRTLGLDGLDPRLGTEIDKALEAISLVKAHVAHLYAAEAEVLKGLSGTNAHDGQRRAA